MSEKVPYYEKTQEDAELHDANDSKEEKEDQGKISAVVEEHESEKEKGGGEKDTGSPANILEFKVRTSYKGKELIPLFNVNENAIKDAVTRSRIGREREKEYGEYIKTLAKYLPENERKDCAENPVDFVSPDTLFRGFHKEDYEEVKSLRRYPVRHGQFAEEAVFFSNSPHTAFTFTRPDDGVVAIIDRGGLIYKDERGIMEVGSEDYQKGLSALLSFLAEKGTDNKDTLYRVNNFWDLSSNNNRLNPLERTIAMRLSQPISATKVFIILRDGVHEEFVQDDY